MVFCRARGEPLTARGHHKMPLPFFIFLGLSGLFFLLTAVRRSQASRVARRTWRHLGITFAAVALLLYLFVRRPL